MNEREAIDLAISALRMKLPHTKCPRCNHFDWNVEIGGVLVGKLDNAVFSIPPPMIKTAFVTCKTCG